MPSAALYEGDAEISIALKNGDVLPDWLHYDANTHQFSGTPNADYAGQVISIEITAKDDVSEIKTNFHIAIASVLGSDANDILTDTAGNDIISGGEGNDELISGLGTDLLLGGAGDDTFDYAEDDVWTSEYFAYNTDTGDKVAVIGMKRSYDVFDGGDGIDILKLTSDNDAYFLDDGYSPTQTGEGRLSNVEKIEAGDGHDIVDLSSSRFTYGDIEIKGGDGNDVVWGNAGNDTLYGDAGDDNVQGGEGNDTLYGGSGADTLKGFAGQDKLEGGTGADDLFGGADADVFVFSKLEDSTTTEMDTIQDFSQGEDQIDVSQLDFNTLVDFQFTFDGTDTIVNAVNKEFAFTLSGEHDLTENDFVF
jgi:Ca2+-binding RTX toxin-like protein